MPRPSTVALPDGKKQQQSAVDKLPKRLQKKHKEKRLIRGISNESIRRHALRTGAVLRVAGNVYGRVRNYGEMFLTQFMQKSIVCMSGDGRKTLSASDAVLAANSCNMPIYDLHAK